MMTYVYELRISVESQWYKCCARHVVPRGTRSTALEVYAGSLPTMLTTGARCLDCLIGFAKPQGNQKRWVHVVHVSALFRSVNSPWWDL